MLSKPNGLSTFVIKDKSGFINGLKSLHKSLPDCPVLYNRVFDNFLLAEELLAKALQSLKTRILVHNNLCRKSFSPLESDEIVQVTSFFIPYFNLLSCELDSFNFKELYWVILN